MPTYPITGLEINSGVAPYGTPGKEVLRWSGSEYELSLVDGSSLETTGAATGPIGDATTVPVVTIDTHGRVTALGSAAITGVPPAAHGSTHEPAGSDEIDWDGKIIMAGTQAARPAAAASNRGSLYFITNLNGGTLTRSDGAAWANVGLGLAEPAGGDLTGSLPSPTLAAAGPGATGPVGAATTVPVITIDAKGRVTGLTSTTITGTVPAAHASTHLPAASDPIDFSGSIIMSGSGAPPAAAAGNAGCLYLRTDLNGGTLYRSNGSSWVQCAKEVSPTGHASTHQPGGSDAMAVDAAAGTGSLRTIGTGALQACAGNDSRLSDSRTPTAHKTSHNAGGSDALSGLLINIQYLYNGTTTYTPTAGTKTAVVYGVAGGGGGGATDWTAGTTAAGAGGGGSGSGFIYKVTSVTGTYTVAIGAGGSAGTVGVNGGAGGNGGNTTFANGATTVTANGGTGAAQASAGSTLAYASGGAAGAVSTNGDFNMAGGAGFEGKTDSGSSARAGRGADAPFGLGLGGQARTAQGNGIAGNGYGSGGSGGVSTSADKTGGAGANGILIIYEYT